MAAGGHHGDAPGRARAITWRGLDLDRGRLSIEQQLLPGGTFGPPKSSRSRRTVALDPETVDALRAHRDTQLLERSFAGPAYVDGDLVFADALGGPIKVDRLSEWFTRHRKAAGIQTGTLHTLRHTAATLALTAGYGSYRRGEAGGQPDDGPGHVRASLAAVGRTGGRADRRELDHDELVIGGDALSKTNWPQTCARSGRRRNESALGSGRSHRSE